MPLFDSEGRVVTHASGQLVDASDASCCCGTNPGGCASRFRFALCSEPLCWPATVPPEVMVCATQTVRTATGAPQNRTIAQVIADGGSVTAKYSAGGVLPCYAFVGPAGPGPVTPAVSLFEGLPCSDPSCIQDLCGQFLPVRPCGNPLSGCGPAFVPAGFPMGGAAFAANCGGPIGSGTEQFVCYCAAPTGPAVRGDRLPAGAKIFYPEAFFGSCCECGASRGACSVQTFPEWVGDDDDGQPIPQTRECCCPGQIARVTASGYFLVGQDNVGDPGGGISDEYTVTGATFCPATSQRSAGWYAVGEHIQTVARQVVYRARIGCPPDAPNPDSPVESYPIATECGHWIRQGRYDYRNPLGIVPSGGLDFLSSSIAGGCLGRSENWSQRNVTGQSQGSTTDAFSFGNWTVALIAAQDDACADGCEKRLFAPASTAAPESQGGCSGCGGLIPGETQ